jgi:multimeric flavodoxin WrbA
VSKNILILAGSPRNNGNSDRMAEAFAKGALAAGHNVMLFNAGRKEIGGCKACKRCWSEGEPCIYRDDFDELAPLLEKADVLLLSTPLYWFTLSAQIMAPINRIYAYLSDNCKRSLKIKESLLFVCGADDDMKVFEGTISTYKAILNYMKWEDKGILTVPGVQNKGDINKTDALVQAEKLGSSI